MVFRTNNSKQKEAPGLAGASFAYGVECIIS